MGGITRITSKALVGIFSIVVFVISIVVLVAGILSIGSLNISWLKDAVPGAAPWVMIGSGALMLVTAIGGITSITCCLNKSKICLALLSLLTFILMALSITGCVLAFNYSEVMRAAKEKGFAGDISNAEASAYRVLRNGFVGAYYDCNATSYFTSSVRRACKATQAAQALLGDVNSPLDVDTCAEDEYGGGSATDYVGMYCRNGPAMQSPLTIDDAFRFPPVDSAGQISAGESVADLLRMRTFGYFLSSTCMPNSTRYGEMIAELVSLSIGVSLPPGWSPPAKDTVFGQCYQAPWWEEETAGLSSQEVATLMAAPTIPDGFKANPDGSALTAQQNVFFNALQASRVSMLGNPYQSAKLSFCMCADVGSSSKFFTFLMRVFGPIQWVSLGLAIFFGLTFLAEVYLGCCVSTDRALQQNQPKQLTEVQIQTGQTQTVQTGYATQPPTYAMQPQRGWQAGSEPGLIAR